MDKWQYEHTDTFGGEANYCWVNRGIVECNEKSVVREVKKALGLTGYPCRKTYYGDMIRLDLVGACQVIFIDWYDESLN